MPSAKQASLLDASAENSRAMFDCSSSRKLTEKAPLSAMIGATDEVRLSQINMVGGSALAVQTAVAVNPPRVSPFWAAITATVDVTWRTADLNSAGVTDLCSLRAADGWRTVSPCLVVVVRVRLRS